MKFVLSYTTRSTGSAAENATSAETATKLLSNWVPSKAATIHQWVTRCDANGGFAVLETNDASELYRDLATWTPWLKFEVHPVIDVQDMTALSQEAASVFRTVL
jgi:hypothetical protein